MKRIKSNKENKKLCENCTSCCEYITAELTPPKTKEDIDELIWYIYHGIIIFIDEENDWMMLAAAKCKKLNKNGECRIYKKRPLICREYDHGVCDKHSRKKKYYKHLFLSEKNLLLYLKKDKKLKKLI